MNNQSIKPLVLAIGIGAAVVATAASWAEAPAAGASSHRAVTILDADGRFVQLDAQSGHKLAEGLYADVAAAAPHVDGSLISDARSSGSGLIYALLARDAQADDNGEQRFRVVTLDAATFKISHSYDLPQPLAQVPRLLLDAARHELVLIAEGSLQRFAISGDGEIRPAGAAVAAERPVPVSPSPYLDAQGDLVDDNRVFDRNGHLIEEVRPDTVLDASLRDKFASLTQIKGSSDHYNGTILAASAGGRMVFTVGWDREDTRVPSAGVVVYDANAHHAVSSFFSAFPVAPGDKGEPGVPNLHLTPDGHRILIEQYDWQPRFAQPRPGEEQRQARFRTGKLAIYDADTGGLTGTVSVGTPANARADGRVLGFSSDARYAYYWFDQHLSVIDLESARVVSSTALPRGMEPAAVVSSS